MTTKRRMARRKELAPQWEGAEQGLVLLEAEHRAGNRLAFWMALQICAITNLPMPGWVAQRVKGGVTRLLLHINGTLDDVFGRPYPPGTQLEKARMRRSLQFRVYERIEALRERGRALDDELFAEVGRYFEVGGKTKTSEIYRAAKRIIEQAEPAPETPRPKSDAAKGAGFLSMVFGMPFTRTAVRPSSRKKRKTSG